MRTTLTNTSSSTPEFLTFAPNCPLVEVAIYKSKGYTVLGRGCDGQESKCRLQGWLRAVGKELCA